MQPLAAWPIATRLRLLATRGGRMLFGAGAAGAVVLFATGAAPATSAVKPRTGRTAHTPYGAPPISSRDRVYTADMASNTGSVIDPKTNKVLGTIPLGSPQLGEGLGPVEPGQVGVHGLGFSRDARLLDVISVVSDCAQLLSAQSNTIATTTPVG